MNILIPEENLRKLVQKLGRANAALLSAGMTSVITDTEPTELKQQYEKWDSQWQSELNRRAYTPPSYGRVVDYPDAEKVSQIACNELIEHVLTMVSDPVTREMINLLKYE